jgi:hypothetical protein
LREFRQYFAGAYEPRHKLAARIGISPITLADLLAGSSASDLLHCISNCQPIFQLSKLCRRRLVQVIDFEDVGRDESV